MYILYMDYFSVQAGAFTFTISLSVIHPCTLRKSGVRKWSPFEETRMVKTQGNKWFWHFSDQMGYHFRSTISGSLFGSTLFQKLNKT